MKSYKEVLTIIENRISINLLIYIITITLIIDAYAIGRLTSIKYRDSNSIVTSSIDNNFATDPISNASRLSGDNNNSSTSTSDEANSEVIDSKIIFGSKKGKYFYYKGCGGANLSPANLVYYKSEQEAINKGKLLYKGCE